jgi:hypothetical protein
MKSLTKILSALLLVFLMSCSKDGETGPQGPPGIDGNANVLYSEWFESGTWAGSAGNYNFNKAATAITQSVLDQGVVLAYCKLTADGSNVRPLPATTSSTTFWNFILTVGNINFTSTLGSAPSIDNEFRYIIIPATTALRLQKPVTEMTYNEVCAFYNIPL